MATGANDANGIWQYGEDDSNTTFSALLNRLGASTSTAIGLIKNDSKGIIATTSGGTSGKSYALLASNVVVSTGATSDVFSMTFNAVSGRLYKATMMAPISTASGSSRYEFTFTNASNTVLRYIDSQSNALWNRIEHTFSYIFTGSGSTTIKLRLTAVDSATTLYGVGTSQNTSLFVIEDIGTA